MLPCVLDYYKQSSKVCIKSSIIYVLVCSVLINKIRVTDKMDYWPTCDMWFDVFDCAMLVRKLRNICAFIIRINETCTNLYICNHSCCLWVAKISFMRMFIRLNSMWITLWHSCHVMLSFLFLFVLLLFRFCCARDIHPTSRRLHDVWGGVESGSLVSKRIRNEINWAYFWCILDFWPKGFY